MPGDEAVFGGGRRGLPPPAQLRKRTDVLDVPKITKHVSQSYLLFNLFVSLFVPFIEISLHRMKIC